MDGVDGSFTPYPFSALTGRHNVGDVICLRRQTVNNTPPATGTDNPASRYHPPRFCLWTRNRVVPYKTAKALISEPIFSLSQVAITLVYRYQPRARAPIDAGKLVADNGKIDGYRY